MQNSAPYFVVCALCAFLAFAGLSILPATAHAMNNPTALALTQAPQEETFASDTCDGVYYGSAIDSTQRALMGLNKGEKLTFSSEEAKQWCFWYQVQSKPYGMASDVLGGESFPVGTMRFKLTGFVLGNSLGGGGDTGGVTIQRIE